jgi:two-component system nitrate/nitrite response regulator NarL
MNSIVRGAATRKRRAEKLAVGETSPHRSSRRHEPALRKNQVSISDGSVKMQAIDAAATAWLFVSSNLDATRGTARAVVDGATVELSAEHRRRLQAILREIRDTAQRPSSETTQSKNGCCELLTPRQLQIAGMVRDGFSNKIIARDLGLTAGTVKAHLHRIYRVLNIANRVELAMRAARHHATNR